jgi:hypothetical protein
MSGTKNIDNGVRIVDVTGDGLPDFLKCGTAGQRILEEIATGGFQVLYLCHLVVFT